ncbi:polymorphic toxin-type HINT domain-containing protein [Lacipirellula sp.]|uniref:polymorphic toxin-type HINT domain-containing protein n=1 Tax=Lacipirellula sp. TaxID=2691419 RepID=UPI003D09A1B8
MLNFSFIFHCRRFVQLSSLAFAASSAAAAPSQGLPEPRPVERPASIIAPTAAPAKAETSAAEPNPNAASQLTVEALAAQLVGEVQERDALLEEAIAADPNFAPARWQRGEMLDQGKWRSVASVQKRLAANPSREEYLELRDSSPDTLAAHAELAQWCMRNGLANEERFHWMKVLFADPRHELAQSQLGLQHYRDGLYTKEEIADFEKKEVEATANLAKYQPIFAEICRTVTTTSDGKARASALASLGSVNELAKLPALANAIAREASQASPEDAYDLSMSLIDSLSHVPHRQATSTLLNLSLFAEAPGIRHAAALGLKSRPVTDYVPQLMASMAAPIQAEIGTVVQPDGTVTYAEILYQEGPLADRTVTRGRTAIPVSSGQRTDLRTDRRADPQRVSAMRGNAAAMAMQARRRVALANAEAAAGNTRVREVLSTALSFDLGEDPKRYWGEWTKYNELQFDEHPLYGYNDLQTEYVPTTHSCFMAGTPVWTQEGLRPIETIVVGDLVLAQHPETGEIAFRPVLEKTLGPPTQTAAIGLPDETIVATLGHRFWVERRGWEMTKALKPGMYLHAVASSLPIETLDAGQQLRCHNMVVDGFHTYFAGRSQILVHDKTCPQPTTSKTPGQAFLVDAAPSDASR